MSHDREPGRTKNYKMPHMSDVSSDPNGFEANGFDSLKALSNDCDKLDAISECSSGSSFAMSSDKEVDVEVVFQNLVEVYRQQLKNIDDLDWDDNRKLQEKVKVLEDFVDQLLEQNEALISTAAELERETKKRVHQMEGRLKKSARSTKEVVLCLHDYEQHMQDSIRVKAQIEAELEDLKQRNTTVKVENGFLRDQNANLRHDLHALLHVIQQARSTGNWEMDWVTFCELSPEQVFGPIGTFSRIHSGESLTQPLHTSDDMGYRGYCQSDRGSCSHYSSFTNLYDPDQGSSRKYDPDCISRLQGENKHLQKLREQSQMELLDKDKIIANLESQITCLNQEIALCQLENDRQLLIYRAQSLEETVRPLTNPKSNLPISHGYSLPYLCGHQSCSHCGMPISGGQDGMSQPTDIRGDIASNSLPLLASRRNEASDGATAKTPNQNCNISNKDQQYISGLFESAYVQTEASAVASFGIQTEVRKSSICVQTEEPKKTVDELMEGTGDEMHKKNMENMKELLRRAEDKASSKEMLITQLQTHLQTSTREVELKDKALENAEQKLDSSRKECVALKGKISELETEILGLKGEIQHELDVQKNLNENVLAREETLREVKVLEQTLQDQKRRLLTQVDEQGEEILRYQVELQTANAQLKVSLAEAELQKLTIQNLQDALIDSKSANSARSQPANGQYPNAQSKNIARPALSQNSVLDI